MSNRELVWIIQLTKIIALHMNLAKQSLLLDTCSLWNIIIVYTKYRTHVWDEPKVIYRLDCIEWFPHASSGSSLGLGDSQPETLWDTCFLHYLQGLSIRPWKLTTEHDIQFDNVHVTCYSRPACHDLIYRYSSREDRVRQWFVPYLCIVLPLYLSWLNTYRLIKVSSVIFVLKKHRFIEIQYHFKQKQTSET